jgi:hypothetical protein
VNARMKVADKKSEAQLRAHEKAQSALGKFKFDCGSMNDKDWGNVICWVLPQAKVDFAVKGFEEGIYVENHCATGSMPCDDATVLVDSNSTVCPGD